MIEGKSIFSWNVPAILNGDSKKFTEALLDGGFEGVCLKAGDGNQVFKMHKNGPWGSWGENIKFHLIEELRKANIKIYLWHFLYGADPRGELSTAIKQCAYFKPDGYIWDAEGNFDSRKTAESSARLISNGLKMIYPDIPQALCWWALPLNPNNYKSEWHPVKVANAFMETVDVVMPMMYWGGNTSNDAISYLHKSLNIWSTLTELPIIPIGRAYTGDGGVMNPVAIKAFANRVLELADEYDLTGISWWSFDKAFQSREIWEALKFTDKFGPQISIKEALDRLINAHQDLFPDLFK